MFPIPALFKPTALMLRGLNALLRKEEWARAALARHSGKTVRLAVGTFTLSLTLDDAGYAQHAAPDKTADVTVTLLLEKLSLAHFLPAHTQADHTQPAHMRAAHIQSAHTQADHTQPTHTQAAHIQPTHTQAVHIQPTHTQAVHTQPAHTQAAHTQPVPTQLVPTQPNRPSSGYSPPKIYTAKPAHPSVDRFADTIHIVGDAGLAKCVAELATHLRWDVEDTLADWIGDIPAVRLVRGVKQGSTYAGEGLERLMQNIAEYLSQERPLLVAKPALKDWRLEVARAYLAAEHLQDRMARLQVRLAQCSKVDPC